MDKIGFIGAGRVGVSLGRYWSGLEGIGLVGYYSRTKASSDYAAQVTNSISFDRLGDLVDKCDVIIITSPDDAIGDIWRNISTFNIQNKIIAHCSGSLSSKIFFDSSKLGAKVCSIHPVLAISSKEYSYRDLKNAFFTLEGDEVGVDFFIDLLKIQENPYKVIPSCDKTKYHMSTVFMSNLIVAVSSIASSLLKDYNFSQEEALMALSKLAQNNMENIFKRGVIDSLTGPVERNDANTVSRHLKALGREGDFDTEDIGGLYKNCQVTKCESRRDTEKEYIKEIYRLLSLELVKIAEAKNCDKNYETMKKTLSKEEDL